MRETIFLRANYFMDISRNILRGPRLFWPLNCPERRNIRKKYSWIKNTGCIVVKTVPKHLYCTGTHKYVITEQRRESSGWDTIATVIDKLEHKRIRN